MCTNIARATQCLYCLKELHVRVMFCDVGKIFDQKDLFESLILQPLLTFPRVLSHKDFHSSLNNDT